jgi:hypothetical protein
MYINELICSLNYPNAVTKVKPQFNSWGFFFNFHN